MQNKKIVITGGPGTGKSSIIRYLEKSGYLCLHEVSREITAEAQKKGVTQLFLEKPLLFSEKLQEARVAQHITASGLENKTIFLDRGLPDVVAYMEYYNTPYPSLFLQTCEIYKYEHVFILPPWEEIYLNDDERYESFEQAVLIDEFLKKTYLTFGYTPVMVPKGSVRDRSEFILNNLPG